MIFWFKNKILRWNFLLGVFLNLVTWIFLYWQFAPQVDPVYLRYSVYFGINLIGDWWQVFYGPALGTLVLVLNYVLVLMCSKKSRFAAYFLAFGASAVQLLLIVSCIFLVMINR